jgi:hypothetical protein
VSKRKLPLDDPRWWPWRRAIEHVRQQRLNHAIADQELATAINERDVPCKMEWLDAQADPPKRVATLLTDSFFAVFRIEPGWGKLLAVGQRPDARLPRDHVCYAWGPEIEKIWPSDASTTPPSDIEADDMRPPSSRPAPPPSERPNDPLAPPRRRPGPPPDTQRWFGICAEIARRCVDPKTGRVQVPKSENKLAEDVLDWLAEIGEGQPSISEMREAVKRVCATLRMVQR